MVKKLTRKIRNGLLTCLRMILFLVAGSFMSPADIRQLRGLMHYRYKLTCFISSEKNRLQNCLTVSNIQLGNVVSEIGVNMEAFPSAKHLCSWAGLTPTNNESAGKKKSVRVSKAGCYIKPLLVQCANSVVKSESILKSAIAAYV